MSNLLQKASIVTTPTAYGVGVLNSIKPAIPFSEELVTNGNFASNSDWTLGTGWTIANGQLVRESAVSGSYAQTSYDLGVIGKKYIISINVAEVTSGILYVYGGLGGTPAISITSSGVYTINHIWASDQPLGIFCNNSFVGKVNNISVKEKTDADFDFTRTSSATRVNPDYLLETVSINSANLVQNGNFSELGSELVTNGDFSNGLSNWSVNGGSYAQVTDGVLISDNSDNGSWFAEYIGQNISFVNGKTYKITFRAKNLNGDLNLRLTQNSNIIFTQNITSQFADYIVYYIANADNGSIRIFCNDAVGKFAIDNVSVKQVDPNDNWTLGTGWSFGTNEAICDGSQSSQSNLFQSGIVPINKTYKVTFTIVVTTGSMVLAIGGSNAQPTVTTSGTYSFTSKATSGDSNLYFSASSDFAGSVTNISVIEIQENGVPRLDYTNGTASILLEPQSTNLIAYSEDLSQLTSQNITIISNYATSPDGIFNATRVVPTTNIAQHRFTPSISVSASTVYTGSIFAKADGYNRIQLTENATTGGTAKFDLQNGTILSTSGVTAKIEAFPNDWYRCSITETTASTSFRFDVLVLDDSSNTTFGGDGTSALQLFGYQLEQKSFSTSYIPTSGSTVTRAAETLNNAANSDLINSTEGVLYVDIAALANDSTYRLIAIEDSSDAANTFIYLGYKDSSNTIRARLEVGGVASADMEFILPNETQFNKIAVKWKQNDFALWVNGVEVATDSSGSSFSSNTLDRLSFDRNFNLNFYGRCKTVAVFKEALSDTELACLTSTNNREIFLNYYYRMQYVGANTEALSCAEQTFNV